MLINRDAAFSQNNTTTSRQAQRNELNSRERQNVFQYSYSPSNIPGDLRNVGIQPVETQPVAPATPQVTEEAPCEIVYGPEIDSYPGEETQVPDRDRHSNHCYCMSNDENYQQMYTANFGYYMGSVNPNSSLMGYANFGMNIGVDSSMGLSSSGNALSSSPYPQIYSSSPYYGVNNYNMLDGIMNSGYGNYTDTFSVGSSNGLSNGLYNMNLDQLMQLAQSNQGGQNNYSIQWPQIPGSNAYDFMSSGNISALGSGSAEDITSMLSQLGQLKEQYGANVDQIESMIGTLTEQLQQLQQEKTQLESARGQKEQQYYQLNSEHQQLTAQKSQLTSQNQQLNAQKGQLEGQITGYKEGITTLKGSITAMEAQAAALATNPVTAAESAALLAQVAQLKGQLALLQTQLAQSEAQLQQVIVQIQQVTAQLQQTEQRLQTTQQSMQQVQQEIGQIDQRLSVVNQQVSVLSQQINQGLNTLVERKTDMSMIDARSNNLQTYSMATQSMPNLLNDPNGFTSSMNTTSSATNILNSVSMIGGLFGLNSVTGGGLFGSLLGGLF